MPSAGFPWEAAATLVSVGVGFLLGEGVRIHREVMAQAAYWRALRREVEFCRREAEGYLRPRRPVMAPLFRLPLRAQDLALGEFLARGLLEDGEIEALYELRSNAEQFNRGLDLADDARRNGTPRGINDELILEWHRNRIKAKKLRPGPVGAPSQYDRVVGVVEARMREWYGRRLWMSYCGRR